MMASADTWWPKEGWTSVLVHNYGGRRRLNYQNGFIRMLLVDFPAHIVVLQEHDSTILENAITTISMSA